MKRWVADRDIDRILETSRIEKLVDGLPEDAGLRYAVVCEVARGEDGRCYDALCRIAARRRVSPSYLVDRATVLLSDIEARRSSDLYRILGVLPLASPSEIRAQWREAVKASHPDAPGGSDARFQAMKGAYDVLGVPRQRVEYEQRWRLEFSPIERARTVARKLEVRGYPGPIASLRRSLRAVGRSPRRQRRRQAAPAVTVESLERGPVPGLEAEPGPGTGDATGTSEPSPAPHSPTAPPPHEEPPVVPVEAPSVDVTPAGGFDGRPAEAAGAPQEAGPSTAPSTTAAEGQIDRSVVVPMADAVATRLRDREVFMHDMRRKKDALFDTMRGIEQRLGGTGLDGMSAVARMFEQLQGALQTVGVEEIDSALADIHRARERLDAMTRDLTRLREMKVSLAGAA